MIGNHKGHEGHKGRETQISQIWADFWRAGARRLSRHPGREKFSLHPRHVRWTCQQDAPETCREKAKLLSLQASKLPIAPAPPARLRRAYKYAGAGRACAQGTRPARGPERAWRASHATFLGTWRWRAPENGERSVQARSAKPSTATENRTPLRGDGRRRCA